MADVTPKVHFNDGEGLDESDLNRLQSLLDAKNMQRAVNTGRMGGAEEMGHTTGGGPLSNGGAEIGQKSPRILSSTRIYTPAPLGFQNDVFELSGPGQLVIEFGPQLFLQGTGPSTPGTPPDGYVLGLMSYMAGDSEIAPSGSLRPVTNNRYDSLNLRLGHQAPTSTESRDFEDSATRALTSTTPAKDQLTLLEHNLQKGAESASPVYPTPASGYARFLTILREVGETTSLNPNNVRLHTYPMQLKTEVVLGSEGWYASGWQKPGSRPGSIEKNGAGSATIQFFPKNMHAGCRLVAVGICFQNMGIDVDDIKLQRMEYDVDGNQTQVDLVNFGNGGPISSTAEGLSIVGLPEFDDADGNDMPIWGNGRTYGPLLGVHAVNPAEGLADSSLLLHVGDTAWGGGENIPFVKFFYLE